MTSIKKLPTPVRKMLKSADKAKLRAVIIELAAMNAEQEREINQLTARNLELSLDLDQRPTTLHR